jgi:hypothetical protein
MPRKYITASGIAITQCRDLDDASLDWLPDIDVFDPVYKNVTTNNSDGTSSSNVEAFVLTEFTPPFKNCVRYESTDPDYPGLDLQTGWCKHRDTMSNIMHGLGFDTGSNTSISGSQSSDASSRSLHWVIAIPLAAMYFLGMMFE